jgi:maltooligosyltrehalose trehalohydrolase
LRIRREDQVIAVQSRDRLEGATFGRAAFVLRFFGSDGDDRLLVVNLGADLDYDPAPEPLLAPPLGGRWQLLWSSDAPRYGGRGIVNPCREEGWNLPGESAVLLGALRASEKVS